MTRASRLITFLPSLAVVLWNASAVGLSAAAAAADDTPPPATAPGNDASGRHHNPAWAACKKQADDQKLQPGDARRDFMKNCVKSAHGSAPATS
jgi:psiF repeat